jgi:hypothetical protein
MDKNEIAKISEATARWLSDNRNDGLGEIFSESHLIIPVAKNLIEQGWSEIKTERHSKKLFNMGNGGDVNYDLDAIKDKKTKILIEMKMLKKRCETRHIKDFVKLAFPPNGSGYTSLFLIAETTIGSPRSEVIQDIANGNKLTFSLPPSIELITKGNPAAKEKNYILIAQGENRWKLTGDELECVRKIKKADPVLDEFSVECAANVTVGSSSADSGRLRA